MSIKKEDLLKVSFLSKINTSNMCELEKDLNNIFSWIDQVSAVDTTRIELNDMNDTNNMIERDDHVDLKTYMETLSNAPETESSFFVVPKVVE